MEIGSRGRDPWQSPLSCSWERGDVPIHTELVARAPVRGEGGNSVRAFTTYSDARVQDERRFGPSIGPCCLDIRESRSGLRA